MNRLLPVSIFWAAAASCLVGPSSTYGQCPAVLFNETGYTAQGGLATSVAIGDFNGDGKLDLAVSNFQGNNVSIFLGSGGGAFQAGVQYGAGNGPESVV